MRDPFTVLGVDEAADDAEIRRRYLALVRDFPPDRAPERFREYRAAYEALSDERKRLEMTLLGTNTIAFSRLCTAALLAASPGSSRATWATTPRPIPGSATCARPSPTNPPPMPAWSTCYST